MKLSLLSAAALLALTLPFGQSLAQESDIVVQDPWARANPPVVANSAAYMTLINNGSEVDRLLGASGEVAGTIELHTHLNEDGVMKMRQVQAIEVAPGSPTVLQPGGLHVMLIGLQSPLEPSQTFPLTLNFEQAGEVTVEVTVRGMRGSMDHGSGMNHGSDMQH